MARLIVFDLDKDCECDEGIIDLYGDFEHKCPYCEMVNLLNKLPIDHDELYNLIKITRALFDDVEGVNRVK